MGLVIFAAIGLYLLISVGVVLWAIRHAKKNGKSVKGWGWGAALVMYLIPFWDWIPTVAVHQYYCATESGFWVYKTLDQWKAENPGVMEGLHQVLQASQTTDYGNIDVIDEIFTIETHRRKALPLITTNIADRRLVDSRTSEILAKGIDVGSGVGNLTTGGGVKFWLNQPPCRQDDFWKIVRQLGQMRGQK